MGFNAGKTGGVGTPIPIKAREEQNRKVNNEVITKRLTPEEMEKEFERLGIKPKNQEQKPIPTHNEIHETKQTEELNDMGKLAEQEVTKRDATPKTMPEKDEYLKLRAEGHKRSKIQSEIFKINLNAFYHLLDQWKIKSKVAEDIAIEGYRLRHGLPVEAVTVSHDDLEISNGEIIVEDSKNDVSDSQAVTDDVNTVVDVSEVAKKEVKRVSAVSIEQIKSNGAVDPEYILVKFPIYNVGTSAYEQVEKISEEFYELRDELNSDDADMARMFHEMFDVFQATFHWLGIKAKQFNVGSKESNIEALRRVIEHHNNLHVEKIKKYAADRGWEQFA